MSRVTLVEGAPVGEPGRVLPRLLELATAPPGDEAGLRSALAAALRDATAAGAECVALAPDAQAFGFSAQRCAEILIEALREATPGEAAPAEVQIVLNGEPTYRIYEAVYDAARIAEQMERIRGT